MGLLGMESRFREFIVKMDEKRDEWLGVPENTQYEIFVKERRSEWLGFITAILFWIEYSLFFVLLVVWATF